MVEFDHNNRTPEYQDAYDSRSKGVRDMILHGGHFKSN